MRIRIHLKQSLKKLTYEDFSVVEKDKKDWPEVKCHGVGPNLL